MPENSEPEKGKWEKNPNGEWVRPLDKNSLGGQYERKDGTTYSSFYNPAGDRLTDQCFVATAVYGAIDHPRVKTLREIRDTVLKPNPVGKKLVELYYSGTGKATSIVPKRHDGVGACGPERGDAAGNRGRNREP